MINILGDQRPCEYYKPDVRTLIKGMQALGWKSATIKRRLQNIRAAFNKISDYHDIDDDKGHPFKNLDIPNEGEDAHERQDFSIAELHQIRLKTKNSTRFIPLVGNALELQPLLLQTQSMS